MRLEITLPRSCEGSFTITASGLDHFHAFEPLVQANPAASYGRHNDANCFTYFPLRDYLASYTFCSGLVDRLVEAPSTEATYV
jgi:hypothetical protein